VTVVIYRSYSFLLSTVLGSTDNGNMGDADEQGWMKMEASPSASGHFSIACNFCYINIIGKCSHKKRIKPNEVIKLMKP
jgi:hypothetical protein